MFDPRSFNWAPVRDALTEALRLVRGPLADAGLQDAANDVQLYIDAKEYGLALDDLCSLLEEARLTVTPDVYARLEAAGKIMRGSGADLDSRLWESLKPELGGR